MANLSFSSSKYSSSIISPANKGIQSHEHIRSLVGQLESALN